ncbi:MAG: hypothetical protein AAB456_03140, partial [Patescibacteria group bacterium]
RQVGQHRRRHNIGSDCFKPRYGLGFAVIGLSDSGLNGIDKSMIRFHPKDIIAVIVLVGVGYFKMKGINGGLDTAAALILGYYFGHRISGVDNGK